MKGIYITGCIQTLFRNHLNGYIKIVCNTHIYIQGRIQDFKLGGARKKNCGERREARKLLGYFVWKITILHQQNHIFSNFRGAPPLDPPLGFTYWLDILKSRASILKRRSANVHNIFDTVICLSHFCIHSALYSLSNPVSIISCTVVIYFRILQNCRHPSSSPPLFILIKQSSIFI